MKPRLHAATFLACVGLGLLALPSSACAAAGPLRLSGTFMQYQDELQTWGPQNWFSVLDRMKELKMDTVIVQMLVRENADGTTHSFIGPPGSPDATESILRYADTNGFKVFLGLYSPSWNHDMLGSNFLVQTQIKMGEVAQQAWDRYLGPGQAHPSFAGWYIPYEPWTADYQPAEVDRLRSFFEGIHESCRLVSGEMPIAISPFISSSRPPPCQVERLYTQLLEPGGIDILLLQDSVGAQQWETNIVERVAPYFQAFQRACQATGVRLWANLESFQISGEVFEPCDATRLRRQFDASSPFVETFVTFDFLHYMNPAVFLSSWDQTRRDRMQQLFNDYKAGFVATDYPPWSSPEIHAKLENGSLSLNWSSAPGDPFQVQVSTNLGSPWANADMEILTNGNSFNVAVATSTQSQSRFYRVQRLPRLVVPESMVWIPPGAFLMGTPASDPYKSVNELPQFQVSLTHGFWMSQLEITQSQYQNLMCTNPARFKGDLDQPVETVSYNDAVEYCARMSQQERAAGRLPDGYYYRLPTEAEWEYSSRAGSTNVYFFGDDPSVLGTYGWYSSNSQGSPHIGGLLLSNPWGLHDTCGNVYEWCLDWIEAMPAEPAVDYRGSTTGPLRAVRGGAWGFPASQCRSSWRLGYGPTVRFATVGFRTVLAVDP